MRIRHFFLLVSDFRSISDLMTHSRLDFSLRITHHADLTQLSNRKYSNCSKLNMHSFRDRHLTLPFDVRSGSFNVVVRYTMYEE